MRLVFDRGTIVLLGLEGLIARLSPGDFADLPGAPWDPRIAALRRPARFHRTLVADLRHRGVRFTDEVAGLPATPVTKAISIDLRPYQAMARAHVPTLCLMPTRALLNLWARAIRELLGFEVLVVRSTSEVGQARKRRSALAA
jgi:hypothetical protein